MCTHPKSHFKCDSNDESKKIQPRLFPKLDEKLFPKFNRGPRIHALQASPTVPIYTTDLELITISNGGQTYREHDCQFTQREREREKERERELGFMCNGLSLSFLPYAYAI